MLEHLRPIAWFGALAILFSVGLVAAPVAGQPTTRPATTQPATTQPASTQPAGTALTAVVQKVSGTVVYAAPGAPGTWKPVRVGDRLVAGTHKQAGEIDFPTRQDIGPIKFAVLTNDKHVFR